MIKNLKFKIKNSTNKTVSVVLSVVVSFLFVFAFATSTTTISSSGITATGSGSFATLSVSGASSLATTSVLGIFAVGTTTDESYIFKIDGDYGAADNKIYFGNQNSAAYMQIIDSGEGKIIEQFNASGVRLGEIDFVDSGHINTYAYNLAGGGYSAIGIAGPDVDPYYLGQIGFRVGSPADGSGETIAFGFKPYFSNLNTAGDGYTAIKLDVTDAQAGATGARNLMDLQTDSVSKFRIDSTGNITGTIINSSSTAYNMFVGEGAGFSNTLGEHNTFLGSLAGYSNTTGNENTFLGRRAGQYNIDGGSNVFVGKEAGRENTSGSENFFGGYQAGLGNTTGDRNIFVGYYAGAGNLSGNQNIFMGYDAASTNKYTSNLIAIGSAALQTFDAKNGAITAFADCPSNPGVETQVTSTGSQIPTTATITIFGTTNYNGNFTVTNIDADNFCINTAFIADDAAGTFYRSDQGFNTAVGYEAGKSYTTGSYNSVFGYQSGYYTTLSSNDTLIGYQAGYGSSTNPATSESNTLVGYKSGYSVAGGAYENTAIGTESLLGLTTGNSNIAMGYRAGYSIGAGDQNVFLGYLAGFNNTGANGNVFIGYSAGFDETGSNKLYIENSGAGSSTALIYGEFDNDILVFNGNIGIATTTPLARLTVGSSTPIYLTSDQYYNSTYISGQLEVGGSATSTFAGYIDVKGAATATSTFTGNVRVLGTLQSGDLAFANAFRFTEDPMPINGTLQEGTQSLKLKNQRGEDILTIDENGNLTIAGNLTTPTSSGVGAPTEASEFTSELLSNVFGSILDWLSDKIMNLKKLIVSEEVCINSTCINENQLKGILENNISPQSSAVSPQLTPAIEPLAVEAEPASGATAP